MKFFGLNKKKTEPAVKTEEKKKAKSMLSYQFKK